jgi:hypothetical protein
MAFEAAFLEATFLEACTVVAAFLKAAFLEARIVAACARCTSGVRCRPSVARGSSRASPKALGSRTFPCAC